jgi:hypothetical protein
MTKSEIYQTYQRMSEDKQRTFNRWLTANLAIGSLFSAALVAMAISASDAEMPGPRHATAQNAQASNVGAPAKEQSGIVSPYELTIRFAPDQLPVQQVDEPY